MVHALVNASRICVSTFLLVCAILNTAHAQGIRELRRLLVPVSMVIVTLALSTFVAYQVILSGVSSNLFNSAATTVIFLAAAWAFWLVVMAACEWLIRSPSIHEKSLDAELTHDGPEQMLHKEAVYITAATQFARRKDHLATHGRDIHIGTFAPCGF